jgi:hypothetical protein
VAEHLSRWHEGLVTTKCGWCITEDHKHCKPSVTWEDKTWLCNCECRGKDPVVEEVVKTRKTRSDKGKKRGPRQPKESTDV